MQDLEGFPRPQQREIPLAERSTDGRRCSRIPGEWNLMWNPSRLCLSCQKRKNLHSFLRVNKGPSPAGSAVAHVFQGKQSSIFLFFFHSAAAPEGFYKVKLWIHAGWIPPGWNKGQQNILFFSGCFTDIHTATKSHSITFFSSFFLLFPLNTKFIFLRKSVVY